MTKVMVCPKGSHIDFFATNLNFRAVNFKPNT